MQINVRTYCANRPTHNNAFPGLTLIIKHYPTGCYYNHMSQSVITIQFMSTPRISFHASRSLSSSDSLSFNASLSVSHSISFSLSRFLYGYLSHYISIYSYDLLYNRPYLFVLILNTHTHTDTVKKKV